MSLHKTKLNTRAGGGRAPVGWTAVVWTVGGPNGWTMAGQTAAVKHRRGQRRVIEQRQRMMCGCGKK
jgi:hypothetical protein